MLFCFKKLSRRFAWLGCLYLCMSSLQADTVNGFFRFSYDNHIQMPASIPPMGLLGLDYLAQVTPHLYTGIGGYGALTGTQGGLFTVGVEADWRQPLFSHWLGDVGLFVGGGGGKASLTGGGLMLRPHAGIAYQWPWASLGVFYSVIDFPSGEIHSQQVGINLDLPMTFFYWPAQDELLGESIQLSTLAKKMAQPIFFQRNDFGLLVQAYDQQAGTKNIAGEVQDETMGLVGAELDHYFSTPTFWWLKMSGAFYGIHNGYMDVLGGLGYRIPLGASWALLPQLGLGAGGGGMVETGGGFLVNGLMSVMWDLCPTIGLKVSSGYLWAPDGYLRAVPVTASLVFHLDMAMATLNPTTSVLSNRLLKRQGWRIQAFNQSYFRPQRALNPNTSSVELIGIQIDQLFNSWFFMAYQATGAYSGYQIGGYATGMIGPGLQTTLKTGRPWQLFTTLLLGAGGGGGLAIQEGALIEPLVGIRYALSDAWHVEFSGGELLAFQGGLNTPVVNVGLSARFDALLSQ